MSRTLPSVRGLVRTFALVLLVLGRPGGAAAAPQDHPLEPPPTHSPRETLDTFLSSIEDVWRVVREGESGNRSVEARQQFERAAASTRRTLDLSQVPPEVFRDRSASMAIELYEVLCRIELPELSEVPGPEEVAAEDLESWTLPHTEITLVRQAEGQRAGEFLFSARTLERTEEFYERVRHLPYRRTPPLEDIGRWRAVYGGWAIPMTWVDALPEVLRTLVWHQALWKWLAAILVLFVGGAASWLVYRLTRSGRSGAGVSGHLRGLLLPLALFGITRTVDGFLTVDVAFLGPAGSGLHVGLVVTEYLTLGWVVWLLALLAGELVLASPRVRSEGLDADLIRLTCQVLGLLLATAVLFQGANRLGIPVVGVIASLSVGGLAVALAAQDTLRSLLASLTILIDQPYRVGERIVVDGHDGVVQRIGLRSTRLRQLDGNVTSIPNEVIAERNIENVGRRQSIRRKAHLRLAVGTPPDRVERAVEIVRDVLADHEGMPEDQPPRVFFDEFHPDSLGLLFVYWFTPPNHWAFLEFGQRVNLEIVRRFAAEGIELAPPTSRLLVSGGAGDRFLDPGPGELGPSGSDARGGASPSVDPA